tara:strand:+ start:1026 stop:1142 length:117 start_codon:yes stop_codon:yes gene_type:complete
MFLTAMMLGVLILAHLVLSSIESVINWWRSAKEDKGQQ